MRVLELFVEKAKELGQRSFASYFNDHGKVGLDWKKGDDGDDLLEIIGPEKDSIDAFLTTFRLFIQGGEPISFRALSKLEDDELSEEWKTNFQKARSDLNNYLAEQPIESNPPNSITRRELLNTFLHGDIFHVNDLAKRNLFQEWKKSSILYVLLSNEFVITIDYIMQIILYVSKISEEELGV